MRACFERHSPADAAKLQQILSRVFLEMDATLLMCAQCRISRSGIVIAQSCVQTLTSVFCRTRIAAASISGFQLICLRRVTIAASSARAAWADMIPDSALSPARKARLSFGLFGLLLLFELIPIR